MSTIHALIRQTVCITTKYVKLSYVLTYFRIDTSVAYACFSPAWIYFLKKNRNEIRTAEMKRINIKIASAPALPIKCESGHSSRAFRTLGALLFSRRRAYQRTALNSFFFFNGLLDPSGLQRRKKERAGSSGRIPGSKSGYCGSDVTKGE